MRVLAAVVVAVGLINFTLNADVKVGGAAAVEFTKKSQNAPDHKNIDGAWIRAEPKLAGSLENSGLTGMIHMRFQYNMASDGKDTAKVEKKFLNGQARQVYFKLPVSILDIQAGRWYEQYGPGYNYFGRYLYGVGAKGNGNMNTNYNVIDGLKLKLNINVIKSALQLAFLPKDRFFEDAYLMAMFGGSPVEGLTFNIGGNLEVITPEIVDPINRFIVNCGYTIVKDLGLGLFGEYAIVDFNEATDNMWFLVGIKTKAGVVLDNIQAELEIKNHRNNEASTDANLAWMILLQKKIMGLTLDLNVGADPTVLGSETAGDVGAIFRVTAKF
ncbi:MAG: hypothetical protein JW863_09405 [Chitinispirillaceae bacterium]|nr:hypothetical protein [Chitinispirillaceae bacterium]